MDRASGVWTVRGVGLEARKVAKAEAAKMGATLGSWLERAIEVTAAADAGYRGEKKIAETEVPLLSPADAPLSPDDVDPKKFRESLPKLTPETKFEEAPPIRAHGRKARTVCQHGVEKGYNCWQCGGLARIQ